MGPGADTQIEWTSEQEFQIGEARFSCGPPGSERCSSAERMAVKKAPWAIAAYEELLRGLQPQRILELGVLEGGSTAMLAAMLPEARLLAVDLSPGPPPVLTDMLDAGRLGERVLLAFETAQDDREAVEAQLDQHFKGAELDLVIDDASHLLPESRVSFEIAFPRLRSGGIYVLEDWSWAHAAISINPGKPPLTLMVFELIMACAHNPGVIASVEVNRGWAVVERGPAELDGAGFRLGDLYGERAASLLRSEGAEPGRGRGKRRRQRARLPWA